MKKTVLVIVIKKKTKRNSISLIVIGEKQKTISIINLNLLYILKKIGF